MSRIIYRDSFAYDLDIKVLTNGEIFDMDVIDQSLESILSTSIGERLFNPSFGSILPTLLFDSVSEEYANSIIDSIVNDITIWEDRITILEEKIVMEVLLDNNSIVLTIPYVVNENNITSSFKRKIIF